MSCSSKTISYDPLGEKTITTRTNEDIYHESQAKAWSGYYKALENPPVIAKIQNPDGTVITISSQVPPPAPAIRQHENQYIKPITEVLKWGIGGVVIDRGLQAIVKGAGDVIVDNAGNGTVIVDKSNPIASRSTTTMQADNSNRADNSNHSDNSNRADNSDRSSIIDQSNHSIDQSNRSTTDSHDAVSEPTIVTQPAPVIVPATDPIIVNPVIVPAAEPVIVDPVIVE